MSIRSVSIAVASLAVVGLTAPAHAGDHGSGYDYKNYSGTGCLSQLARDAGLIDRAPNLIQHSGGPRERQVRIMCPIVRDNVLPSRAIDASVTTTLGVDCTFFSVDRAAGIVAQVQPSSAEDFGPNVRKHYFVLKESQTAFDGTYSIRCTLSPGQAVFGYNVGELTDTTDTNT
jgi:hypothetical protein